MNNDQEAAAALVASVEGIIGAGLESALRGEMIAHAKRWEDLASRVESEPMDDLTRVDLIRWIADETRKLDKLIERSDPDE